ncbi:uncharacterized protein EDB93DRAFT_1106200 [Suillus bovinus]|uniref:uncharacterized protein n=1 Tax=Suillus bovinus TaxID=48563 RepID=UPI001B880566|nr:uncharacterized protein EDB93DRAFT_1106200 [Suillus bovinus]KAG2139093.1 hypothetical protein EDB93DRAFT_1106200 [Suillus bovinus]
MSMPHSHLASPLSSTRGADPNYGRKNIPEEGLDSAPTLNRPLSCAREKPKPYQRSGLTLAEHLVGGSVHGCKGSKNLLDVQKNKDILGHTLKNLSLEALAQAVVTQHAEVEWRCLCALTTAWHIEAIEQHSKLLHMILEREAQTYANAASESLNTLFKQLNQMLVLQVWMKTIVLDLCMELQGIPQSLMTEVIEIFLCNEAWTNSAYQVPAEPWVVTSLQTTRTCPLTELECHAWSVLQVLGKPSLAAQLARSQPSNSPTPLSTPGVSCSPNTSFVPQPHTYCGQHMWGDPAYGTMQHRPLAHSTTINSTSGTSAWGRDDHNVGLDYYGSHRSTAPHPQHFLPTKYYNTSSLWAPSQSIRPITVWFKAVRPFWSFYSIIANHWPKAFLGSYWQFTELQSREDTLVSALQSMQHFFSASYFTEG